MLKASPNSVNFRYNNFDLQANSTGKIRLRSAMSYKQNIKNVQCDLMPKFITQESGVIINSPQCKMH